MCGVEKPRQSSRDRIYGLCRFLFSPCFSRVLKRLTLASSRFSGLPGTPTVET